MRLIYILSFFVFFSLSHFSQSSHFVGMNIGYGNFDKSERYSYPIVLNQKFEANINYFFNYKLLMFKTEYGVIPFTNFGNIYKFNLLLGISTVTDKLFSFYFLTGGGGYRFAKSYIDIDGTEYYHTSKTYLTLNTGALIRPFRHLNIALGLNLMLTGMAINVDESKGKFITYTNYYDPFIPSLSMNLNVQRKKNKKTK